jgi:hypothetical protein
LDRQNVVRPVFSYRLIVQTNELFLMRRKINLSNVQEKLYRRYAHNGCCEIGITALAGNACIAAFFKCMLVCLCLNIFQELQQFEIQGNES